MIKNDFCVILMKFRRFFKFPSFLMSYFSLFLSILIHFANFLLRPFRSIIQKSWVQKKIFSNFFSFFKLHHVIVKYVFKMGLWPAISVIDNMFDYRVCKNTKKTEFFFFCFSFLNFQQLKILRT